jgi:hypothetical protein
MKKSSASALDFFWAGGEAPSLSLPRFAGEGTFAMRIPGEAATLLPLPP